jgi:peptidoglycan hydrolase-like protein with peptidoglycan-binding domain
MTAASLAQSFAHLPMQVGGAALAHAGRAALWIIARYMRSPLTNSAILALVVTTAMAGSNALYGQRHAHPAPLFAPQGAVETAADVDVVVPAVRPKGLGTQAVAVDAASEAEPAALLDTTPGPIGNADVFEVQRKLEMLQLFSGKIDGYYGPQTAGAIRKFEELRGLKPTGELTADIVQQIRNAPLSAADPQPKATPAPLVAEEPEPAAIEPKPALTVNLPRLDAPKAEDELPAAKPAAAVDQPVAPQTLALAEPAPLELSTGSIGTPRKQPAKLLGRPLPDSPEAALEMAADTAGAAIETIISGVQTVAMNNPGKASFAAGEQKLTAEASADQPQVGVPLRIDDEPQKPGTAVAVLDTPATPREVAPISVSDPVVVAKVQRGLASLGFLHGPADGVAGAATAKAIRNFEVYFNYKVTGRISPELLDLLVENGASI